MTRMASDPKSWRELRQRLLRIGARRIRISGSHEKWRFPDGRTFIAICNHLGDAVPVATLVKFRRQYALYRAAEADEPPLFVRF